MVRIIESLPFIMQISETTFFLVQKRLTVDRIFSVGPIMICLTFVWVTSCFFSSGFIWLTLTKGVLCLSWRIRSNLIEGNRYFSLFKTIICWLVTRIFNQHVRISWWSHHHKVIRIALPGEGEMSHKFVWSQYQAVLVSRCWKNDERWVVLIDRLLIFCSHLFCKYRTSSFFIMFCCLIDRRIFFVYFYPHYSPK